MSSPFNLPGKMGHIATGVSAEYTVVKKKSQDGSCDGRIKTPNSVCDAYKKQAELRLYLYSCHSDLFDHAL